MRMSICEVIYGFSMIMRGTLLSLLYGDFANFKTGCEMMLLFPLGLYTVIHDALYHFEEDD